VTSRACTSLSLMVAVDKTPLLHSRARIDEPERRQHAGRISQAGPPRR
jgi:hypothetical protein